LQKIAGVGFEPATLGLQVHPGNPKIAGLNPAPAPFLAMLIFCRLYISLALTACVVALLVTL